MFLFYSGCVKGDSLFYSMHMHEVFNMDEFLNASRVYALSFVFYGILQDKFLLCLKSLCFVLFSAPRGI